MTYEQINGALSLVSNTPGMPTGYGTQGMLLAEKLVKHGIDLAVQSNYGLEGKQSTLEIAGKQVPHYPRGYDPYSLDVIPAWAKDFESKHPDKKHVLMTLYDVWVFNKLKYDGPIIAWVPLDHITLPPMVQEFLVRENVTPITMSPHGQRQLEAAGIPSVYIPHAIDTKIYKPTPELNGMTTKQYMGIPEDSFLVGMVAANKANGSFHRKAFAENLLAFALHLKKHPNSYLYIHSEASKVFGGFNLPVLLKMVGIPKENVLLPDSLALRTGYAEDLMAHFYTGMDVLLSTSYGEGFGVPTVEAQACGTRVITSNYAASMDLASEDSWKIDGQAFWDEAQASFFTIPSINGIVKALGEAYEAPRGVSQVAIDFAKKFDVDYVWKWHWMPFLRELFK